MFAENRDALLDHCINHGVQAKVHYPVPIYLQPALSHLKHQIGDFPVTDKHAKSIISFPCDQHLSKDELDFVISLVTDFYS